MCWYTKYKFIFRAFSIRYILCQLSLSSKEYSCSFNVLICSKLEEDCWKLLRINKAITRCKMSPNGPEWVADPEAARLAKEKLMLSSAFVDLSGFHMTNKQMSQFLLFLRDCTRLRSEINQRKTGFISMSWLDATVIHFKGAGYFQTAERPCHSLNLGDLF